MAEKPTYEELERRIREIEQTESERKRSERILWESREKFQVLSEQSIMGIAIIQKDGFRYVNEAYLNLTGYPKDEILAIDGSKLPVKADTLCFHGDNPGLENFLPKIRNTWWK